VKGVAKRAQRRRILPFLTLISLLLAGAPSARAGTPAAKQIELPAVVIAHLDLPAPPGNQMVLQKQANKRYLYIQQASQQGYTIVEVTQAEFPSFVNRQAASSSGDSSAAKAEAPGQDSEVPETPDTASKTAVRSAAGVPETVKVMDLSDPEHPATRQTIKNVTSLLADGGRGILYVANDEGLWVLKIVHEKAPPPKKPPCDIGPNHPVIRDDC